MSQVINLFIAKGLDKIEQRIHLLHQHKIVTIQFLTLYSNFNLAPFLLTNMDKRESELLDEFSLVTGSLHGVLLLFDEFKRQELGFFGTKLKGGEGISLALSNRLLAE